MMKKYLLTLLLASNLASCSETEIQFKVSVKDENENSLANVECIASMYRGKAEGGPGLAPYNVRGMTNLEGIAILQGNTEYFNNTVVARKEGYYESRIDRMWITGRNDNRWEPWPVEVNFVMKRIIDPRPMYVVCGKVEGRFRLPEWSDTPIGFDLFKRDWVAPHGEGVVPDFLVKGVKRNPKDENSGEGWLQLTFSNEGDGILPLNTEHDGGSILIGPHEAPENGYLSEWKFPNFPVTGSASLNPVRSSNLHAFRIRTKLDENGNVKEAYYGKMYNGMYFVFSQHAAIIRTTYYLNQESNHRGLEWDLENNLFTDITSGAPRRH